MGQVSILEDIEKAIENLAAIKGSNRRPPTEAAIASQEKRLEKERLRLHDLANSLLNLAETLKRSTLDPKFKDGRKLLEIQNVSMSINSLKDEKVKLEAKAKSLKSEIKQVENWQLENRALQAKLDALADNFTFDGCSIDKSVKILKQILSIKLSTIIEEHPTIKSLRGQIEEIKSNNKRLNEELLKERARVKRLQQMLSPTKVKPD